MPPDMPAWLRVHGFRLRHGALVIDDDIRATPLFTARSSKASTSAFGRRPNTGGHSGIMFGAISANGKAGTTGMLLDYLISACQ
jgi:hypothetical protein